MNGLPHPNHKVRNEIFLNNEQLFNKSVPDNIFASAPRDVPKIKSEVGGRKGFNKHLFTQFLISEQVGD